MKVSGATLMWPLKPSVSALVAAVDPQCGCGATLWPYNRIHTCGSIFKPP